MLGSKKQVAVIIPFYKSNLTNREIISLTQCFNILSEYRIIGVKPKSLDISTIYGTERLTCVEEFDDLYFKDVQGYNHLMLSEEFYKRFLNFEYILIYQLDAFVFRNELEEWCRKGFDYVGAPWFKRKENKSEWDESLTELKKKFYTFFNIYKRGLPSDRQFDNVVGNGGFSLRRVQKFYEIARDKRALMKPYLEREEFKFHEDVFWSIEVNRKSKILNIPSYRIGLQFSFENKPERAYQLNNKQLPFGCHAWDLHPNFWESHFRAAGVKMDGFYN